MNINAQQLASFVAIMKDGLIENKILEYLKTRPEDLKWGSIGHGKPGKIYSKEETIKLFSEDKIFRQNVIKAWRKINGIKYS